jgi:hypothetical protein
LRGRGIDASGAHAEPGCTVDPLLVSGAVLVHG